MTYIPSNWRFTPVDGKAAFEHGWQNGNDHVVEEIDSSKYGYGLVLGERSGNIVAVDFDGKVAWDYFDKYIGLEHLDQDIPIWTSGKPNRCQMLWRVPEHRLGVVNLRTVKVGPDKNNRKLEFRWNAAQSVVPPSKHPETGQYSWVVEPREDNIKDMPEAILRFWMMQCLDTVQNGDIERTEHEGQGNPDDVLQAVEFLSQKIGRPDYQTWLEMTFSVVKEIGTEDGLLMMTNFFPEEKVGEYDRLMKSYDPHKAPGMGTLVLMCREYYPNWNVKHEEEKPVVEVKTVETPEPETNDDLSVIVNLLPNQMQDVITGMKKLSNIPTEMTLPAALAVANFAAQGHADVDPLVFGVKPLSQFFITIQGSGGAKSTVYDTLLEGYTNWRDEKLTDYEREMDQYHINKDCWEMERKKRLGIKDQYERKQALIDLGPAPKAPLTYMCDVEQPTVKGLFRKLEAARPSIGLFTSEAGQFLSSHSFQDGTTTVNMGTTLTKLWDNQGLTRDVGDESIAIMDRRFCMFLMVQEEVGSPFLTNKKLDGQGLLPRCLINIVPGWDMPEMDLSDTAIAAQKELKKKYLRPWTERIYELFRTELPYHADSNQRLNPPVLKWNEDARNYANDWFNNRVRRFMNTIYADIEKFAKRSFEHMVRVAGTLCVFDGRDSLTIDDIKAATLIMDWYMKQKMKLDLPTGDERDMDEKPIIDKLVSWWKNKPNVQSVRNLTRDTPRAFRDLNATKRVKILDAMILDNLIEEVKIQTAGKKDGIDGYRIL